MQKLEEVNWLKGKTLGRSSAGGDFSSSTEKEKGLASFNGRTCKAQSIHREGTEGIAGREW